MRKLIAILAVLALALAACGGDSSDNGSTNETQATSGGSASAGDAAAGEDIYSGTCAACHGADATGIEGLGADLHGNEFIAGLSDSEAVDFLKEGRPASDPANTAGVDMPPKGGNPSLSDQDLLDVVAYLRTLD